MAEEDQRPTFTFEGETLPLVTEGDVLRAANAYAEEKRAEGVLGGYHLKSGRNISARVPVPHDLGDGWVVDCCTWYMRWEVGGEPFGFQRRGTRWEAFHGGKRSISYMSDRLAVRNLKARLARIERNQAAKLS